MPSPRPTLTEQEILRHLASGLSLTPFHFELEEHDTADREAGYDGVLRARSEERGLERRFAFVSHVEWSRRALEQTIARLRTAPKPLLPLVIFPYLSTDQLEELRELRVSGLDLCGNGLIYDPPRVFVLRSGAKKTFKLALPTRSVYHSRNVGTLVARMFLSQPVFPTGQAVLEECQARAMPLAGKPPPLVLPTVSKTLSQLVEDLVITRHKREVRLRDPARLLTNLARHFHLIDPPEKDRFFGKTALSAEAVWIKLKSLRPGVRAVVTGRGSASHYTGLAGPDRLQLHVSHMELVAQALEMKRTRAFPNVELVETQEEAPYFDAREQAGFVWASPVHTFLEMSEGTPRERDVAQDFRVRLIRDAQALLQASAATPP